MRTTSKEFCQKVRNHITERLSEEAGATTAEQLQTVCNEFVNYWNGYEQKRNPNQQTAFIDFLQGLPSCLNVEFYYYNQRKALQEWHEQTDKEVGKYSDDQIATAYYWLIYREFCRMCKIAGIEF